MTALKDPEKINPLMGLPAMAALACMPIWVRATLVQLMAEIKQWAEAKAQHSWKKRKAPLAAYWLACGVYAGHVGRGLRKGLPSTVNTVGVQGYLDVNLAHLSSATVRLLKRGGEGLGVGFDVAPYTTGIFVSVAPAVQPLDVPQDLRRAIELARRSGVGLMRFDPDGELHALPVEAPVFVDEELKIPVEA